VTGRREEPERISRGPYPAVQNSRGSYPAFRISPGHYPATKSSSSLTRWSWPEEKFQSTYPAIVTGTKLPAAHKIPAAHTRRSPNFPGSHPALIKSPRRYPALVAGTYEISNPHQVHSPAWPTRHHRDLGLGLASGARQHLPRLIPGGSRAPKSTAG
jgi:hypothetical protein